MARPKSIGLSRGGHLKATTTSYLCMIGWYLVHSTVHRIKPYNISIYCTRQCYGSVNFFAKPVRLLLTYWETKYTTLYCLCLCTLCLWVYVGKKKKGNNVFLEQSLPSMAKLFTPVRKTMGQPGCQKRNSHTASNKDDFSSLRVLEFVFFCFVISARTNNLVDDWEIFCMRDQMPGV